LLTYDAGGNFAAQFMRRDRVDASQPSPMGGSNNTSAVNGYDAYFGTYTVDEKTGTVTQSLSAALSPANVGMVVTREVKVEADTLVIELATTRPDGEAIIRTLRWTRAS
jgi:Lipocalin-like domain